MILSFMDLQIGRNADGTWDNSGDAQVHGQLRRLRGTPHHPTGARRGRPAEAGFADLRRRLRHLDAVLRRLAEGGQPHPDAGPEGSADHPRRRHRRAIPPRPYKWAQEMTAALGSAVLLTYEGDGHTAFLHGDDCIDHAVADTWST